MPVVGLIGVVWVWLETRDWRACGLIWRGLGPTLGWAALLVLVVTAIITPLLQPLLDDLTGTKTDYSAYGALRNNAPAAMHLIGYAWISAAFGEELVFRAFLMHQLEALFDRIGLGRVSAAVAGGVLFGVMHANQGISGVLLTGFVGAGFGYAYLRSNRNLGALIVAHGLVDTWGVTTLYLGWY
ncbi:CPBP family intramembrane glutamic endopeptidase [Xanthomonas vesicatoria]|nr:CPBP family intramembrane glutamic endopeptidase [Xanthomonas vesicatoria]APP77546.1 CAAX protease family protein [Xanthomonas vesicatoria ATCC 35937]KTF32215.1 CAAX protease [Xanthomonas vesicatoria]KTF36380.1 CAAX protease [Xanthomonas vesicatoria]MCC8559695.1 CPBP family intramembrane metalloprotease [Xanthomonas vesicatoria]MCC8595349.1 CPBP family intramembrane metalloprotease [Xanthomonas vesicatoria]